MRRESRRGLSASSERRRKPSLMWIVRLALSRPYTFVVMGLVILLLGVFAIVTTPTDIFPEIDIPVVSVIWNYDGLTTEDMASRITTFSEYTISSAVNDVRSIESQTYPGVGVIKIYFQPNVNVEGALAQVTAVSQTILRRMPPGAVPPFILQYNASSVPIIQLALGGKTLSEAQLYDYGIYRIRQQIAPIQGIALPLPYGGKPRQIMVDLDPQALLAKRPHDPPLPPELAQHARRDHVDPALDPHVAGDPQRDRPDAQRHDARRAGPGGRHPRRRRHRGDREHPSEPRARPAPRPGDPRRRPADRDARVRLRAVDLHRLRPRRVPHRPREVPVHAAGDGRSVRHARVVSALAHDRPHARALPAGERGPRPRLRGDDAGLLRPDPRRVSATVRAAPRGVRQGARDRPRPARARARRLRRRVGERGGACPVRRARLLPLGRHRAVPPPRPRAGRHPHRGDRAGVRRRRSDDSALDPEGRDRAGH